jgi:hypothetical protein
MRRVRPRFPIPVATLAFSAAIALGVGCNGTLNDATGGAAGHDSIGTGASSSAGAAGSSAGTSTIGGGAANVGGSTGAGSSSSPGMGGANGAGAGSAGTTSGGTTSKPTLTQVATQYFPGQTAANAPKRVFRLTRTQLDITTKTLLPAQFSATAVTTLPRDPLQTNYEYADNLGFNPANFTPLTTWVAQIAAAVKKAPTSVIDCSASNDSPACLTDQAKKFVSRAFRGTLTDAQLKRFTDFFTASVASVGLADATADLVDLVLTSPNYVFRDEVLTDASSLLLPAQQLQNITYTLADAPPETIGLSSATPAAYLQTPELAQKTIDQVLASAEARSKLLRFFLAWLEVKEPDEFTIATSVFPEFTPAVAAAIVNETKGFLERQLAKAAPRMKDVTESNQASISSAEAFLYGKTAAQTGSVVELDPSQRLGIFTQPAVLASHSGPTTSRLVKRGVFFVRKVMCMPLGAPPPGIDTTVPTSAGATERQRVETVTAQTKCAGCHAFINPFGFMQENYDAIGRFRTTDEGAPIDPSINVSFLDEGPLSTSSPVDALRAITRSWRFQQCFARQLFRFYTGRDEAAGDDPVLRQMFFDFANNDEQDILRMLHTLASSSTFSRRSELP